MEMDAIWNTILTGVVGFIVWWAKSQSDETKRVTILVNQTREQMAREYVTKSDQHADMNRVIDRLEALDAKLDRLMDRRGHD